MTRDVTGHPTRTERPYLLILLGFIGCFGCLSLIVGTAVAPFFVPDHDWVADTISDLAAGRSEIIMDVALYGFAAGLFAVSLAAAHMHLGGVRWSIGLISLAILASLVVIVGARNEYGDGDSEGIVIHIYLVYGLGALFLLAPLCLAPGLRQDHGRARKALIALGLLWGLCAPLFLFTPTGVDGLVERLLGLVACAIVALLALVAIRRGRAAL
ncbi:DUF998 domain-containing protein [Rhodophyticola porphyridii]|uniref:DUF998 domain-containing protein n=1 Tax=Rhodophyticola porphyridii TaxID=1852017 RepID=UPI0035CF1C5A